MGNNVGSYPASLKVASNTQDIEEDETIAVEPDDVGSVIYHYNGG